jgi:hypothetical protein
MVRDDHAHAAPHDRRMRAAACIRGDRCNGDRAHDGASEPFHASARHGAALRASRRHVQCLRCGRCATDVPRRERFVNRRRGVDDATH